MYVCVTEVEIYFRTSSQHIQCSCFDAHPDVGGVHELQVRRCPVKCKHCDTVQMHEYMSWVRYGNFSGGFLGRVAVGGASLRSESVHRATVLLRRRHQDRVCQLHMQCWILFLCSSS